MVTDPEAILVDVAERLDRLRIPYALGGSAASSHFGEPRATNGIDLIVDATVDQADAIADDLEGAYFIDRASLRAAVGAHRSIQTLHKVFMFKVDFFVAGNDRLARRQIDGALDVPIGGRVLRVCSPEDIVLRKLEWFRLSDGVLERQLRDVAGVLKVSRESLDVASLREAATVLGLRDLLERVLQEAGIS